MKNGLLIQIQNFLNQLEATQNRLWTLYLERREAVRRAKAADMVRIAETEAQLSEEMKSHLAVRKQILEQAARIELPSDSIEELVLEISGEQKDQLMIRINRSKELAEKIRVESWIQWIVSQRSINHCKEMLDIIANQGEKSPTYHTEKETSSTGGVILDASI